MQIPSNFPFTSMRMLLRQLLQQSLWNIESTQIVLRALCSHTAQQIWSKSGEITLLPFSPVWHNSEAWNLCFGEIRHSASLPYSWPAAKSFSLVLELTRFGRICWELKSRHKFRSIGLRLCQLHVWHKKNTHIELNWTGVVAEYVNSILSVFRELKRNACFKAIWFTSHTNCIRLWLWIENKVLKLNCTSILL